MEVQFRKNREIFRFLSNEIEKAKISVKVALAWFTDPDLLKLLLNKKGNDKIEVSIILFNDGINRILTDLNLMGDSVRFSNQFKFDYIMHHKFCIIDDSKVITGSYNWTVKARRYNKENIVLIEDKDIALEFGREFDNLLKNSQPQRLVTFSPNIDQIDVIENLEVFNLEQSYNREIERRIEVLRDLDIGIDIALAYSLIQRHTPVIAATLLATAEDGHYIQSALQKLERAGRLDLCFEESIIRKEYAILFDDKTRESAKHKLKQLNFFTNPKYQHLWRDYD